MIATPAARLESSARVRALPEIVNFDVVKLAPTATNIASPALSRELHSLRVPDDFELPDQPLTPEETLAWWKRKQQGAAAE